MNKDELDPETQDQTDEKGGSKALSKGQKKKLKKKGGKDGEGDKDDGPETETTESTTTTQPPKEEAKTTEPATGEKNEDDEDGDDEGGDAGKGLSKGQKKKMKKKAGDKAEAPAEKKEEKPAEKDTGKKKPLNAAAKLAQQKLLEKQALEAEQKRLEDEARKKEEEEEAIRLAEEEKIRIEKERKKKEIDDAKKLRIAEAGYKTPQEMLKEAEMAKKRADLLAERGLTEDQLKELTAKPHAGSNKKFLNKKKGGDNKTEAKPEAEKPEEKVVETKPEVKPEEPADDDDWESAANKIETKIEETKVAEQKPEPVKVKDEPKQQTPKEQSKNKPSDNKILKPTANEITTNKTSDKQVKAEEEKVDYSNQTGPSDYVRSPVCCILGHVDTGKTKLLDKIRQTNVQEGEAGGITQQIGATYFPVEAIRQKTAVVNPDGKFDFKVPGLLIIDTPGHESFSNLRSRGSSLCNIAILVVDIMHGLEPQTLESMKMLRDRKTPFIVALNKIDRLYGWKQVANNGFQDSLALQSKAVRNEFETRLDKTKIAFAEQGFNSELFYQNKSMSKYVSLVPTSAHTGEGVPDMLKLIVQLTQERMVGSLMYLSEVQATVLEVKAIEGFGMTIDVVLSNGILREGDRIVLCGTEGAIKTNIRALLTPAPLRELRLKSAYVHNKEVKAALGVKISAPGLEGAIAGSRLMVVGPDDDEDDIEDEVEADLAVLFNRVEKSGRGVSVQASTLGSLEALLDFLRESKIPVANVGIGPVYKRDVMQCGVMLEKAPDLAIMLCFDVKVDKEAQQYADDQGIKIFTADIIYHLFDAFTKHMNEQLEKKKEESKMLAVFPCVLKPVKVFNKNDPIVIGVDVTEGQLRINCPVAAVRNNPTTGAKEIIKLGRVTSIEREHKQIPVCKRKEPSVAIKIEMGSNQPMYGRHLEEEETLYSLISRKSIDTLKEFYRKDVSNDEWQLIIKLKPLFDI